MVEPFNTLTILYGEDARRFLERMEEKRTESPEDRERRLRDYEDCMAMLKYGEELEGEDEDDEQL